MDEKPRLLSRRVIQTAMAEIRARENDKETQTSEEVPPVLNFKIIKAAPRNFVNVSFSLPVAEKNAHVPSVHTHR